MVKQDKNAPLRIFYAIFGIPCPYIPYTFAENTCLRGICQQDVNALLDTNELSSNFLACTLAGLCLDWSFLLLQKARTRIPTGTLFVSCMGRKETSPIKWMIKPHQLVGLDQEFIWSSYHLLLQTLNIPLWKPSINLELLRIVGCQIEKVEGLRGRSTWESATCVNLSRSKHFESSHIGCYIALFRKAYLKTWSGESRMISLHNMSFLLWFYIDLRKIAFKRLPSIYAPKEFFELFVVSMGCSGCLNQLRPWKSKKYSLRIDGWKMKGPLKRLVTFQGRPSSIFCGI